MSRAGARRSPARLDPRAVPGAKPAPFPGFVEPCHPTLRQKAPSGGDWVHEIKFDGYRTQAHPETASLPSTRGGATPGRGASGPSPMAPLDPRSTTTEPGLAQSGSRSASL
jgi:hypothetical protein